MFAQCYTLLGIFNQITSSGVDSSIALQLLHGLIPLHNAQGASTAGAAANGTQPHAPARTATAPSLPHTQPPAYPSRTVCTPSQIFERKTTTVKNFGVWVRYQSRTGYHNM